MARRPSALMFRMRWLVAASAAVMLVFAGCSDGDAVSEQAPTTSAGEKTVTTGPPAVTVVPPATTEAVDPEVVGPVRDHLTELEAGLPYPPEVLDCIAGRAAGDDDLRGQIADADPAAPDTMAAVLDTGADCTHTLVASPRFAQAQQRAHEGSLSDDQLACLRDGYAALTPEQIEAATGAALNPGAAADADGAPVNDILASCDVA